MNKAHVPVKKKLISGSKRNDEAWYKVMCCAQRTQALLIGIFFAIKERNSAKPGTRPLQPKPTTNKVTRRD
jgi:hypothetical protein